MATAGRSTEELASELYEQCQNKFSTAHLFYQEDLLNLGVIPNRNVELLLACVQYLVERNLFRMHEDRDNRLAWKLISQEDAERISSLNENERIVYNVIHSTGRTGIWIRPLGKRTNLHKSNLDKALKSLESKNYIKSVHNVRFPGRKVYMLADLAPAEDVTGGAWFTDGVLDAEFIGVLSDYIEYHISKHSWYEVPASQKLGGVKRQKLNSGEAATVDKSDASTTTAAEKRYLPYPAGYKHYPSVSDITAEVNKVGITPVKLDEGSVSQLLRMLCYDNKLIPINNENNFRAVQKPPDTGLGRKKRSGDKTGETVSNSALESFIGKNGLTEAPCGQCPVFNLCQPGGAVNPENCEYFDTWLEKVLGF
ncbi:hypothetical protein VTN31DRAFT_2753 [Thermomyces dupontii]|uniref:uncharacterized protein n=1 Tax=Talaromyces thermophilus TaxID=28565 RepID=UPI003743ACC9